MSAAPSAPPAAGSGGWSPLRFLGSVALGVPLPLVLQPLARGGEIGGCLWFVAPPLAAVFAGWFLHRGGPGLSVGAAIYFALVVPGAVESARGATGKSLIQGLAVMHAVAMFFCETIAMAIRFARLRAAADRR